MLTFRCNGKLYCGSTALDIVRGLEGDTKNYPHRGDPIRRFLRWSIEDLRDRVPPRELDLSDRLSDGELALSYLYLRDEYGAGKLVMQAEIK